MDYDVIVIGVGSAGSRAASHAHKAGAKVLAIEGGEELGGLCILRGCMPTKTLLESAHRVHEIRDAARFGIKVGEPEIQFDVVMERMRQLVARFKRAKVSSIENGGYELRRGKPRFTGPNRIELDGETHTAKAFVVATGSVVRPFPFDQPPGVPIWDSDDMFELTEVPKRVAVMGGGAVGLEFAQFLARMGTEVTLIVRSALLHRSDAAMGQALGTMLAEEMTVWCPSSVQAVEPADGGGARIRCTLQGGEEVSCEVDAILNAMGRVPNVADLNLPAVGIEGDVQIDPSTFVTQVPHVFFAGDVTGSKAILHEANLEGTVVGQNAARVASGEAERARYDDGIPTLEAIFTDPPVAWCGRTPQQLEAAGVAYETAEKEFPRQGRGIVVGARHGFMRLVAEPGGGKVLGAQVFGPRADDLIHLPAMVMRMEGTVKQMYSLPWYHPTLTEAYVEVCRPLAT